MREYLIRKVAGHAWPALHDDRLAEVLQPRGWGCAPDPGWGDHSVRCGSAVVSYSAEDVGWHVVVDGELSGADTWVEQVTRQVAAAAGEDCEWVELT
ncbi:hypothetical protein [Jiangella anatolica]|uniref:Uncharacterized protein n=1 Tax=Jiangella anatolica TaxID=2670374 RepID=A0A2W2CTD5_9ACTN|nr:hypothetical protein [Jiangella anatolica]PZF83423.1 hypothetical protein C1I92_12495 [Jiangella anatolica]